MPEEGAALDRPRPQLRLHQPPPLRLLKLPASRRGRQACFQFGTGSSNNLVPAQLNNEKNFVWSGWVQCGGETRHERHSQQSAPPPFFWPHNGCSAAGLPVGSVLSLLRRTNPSRCLFLWLLLLLQLSSAQLSCTCVFISLQPSLSCRWLPSRCFPSSHPGRFAEGLGFVAPVGQQLHSAAAAFCFFSLLFSPFFFGSTAAYPGRVQNSAHTQKTRSES